MKKIAEAPFQNKELTEARETYQKIYKIMPEYSKMTTYIGQTYEYQKKFDLAKSLYQKSIENNYIDYMAHWFLGRLLFKSGKIKEGIKELSIAHILNRNHKYIFAELKEALLYDGLLLEDWTFNPQIELEQVSEQKVIIKYQTQWLGYALVKACWAFEPDYKKSMGVEDGIFSSLEEKEALASLYVGVAKDKKILKKPTFNTLKNALENKSLDQYILYEVMFAQHPIIALQLPQKTLESISEYILQIRCSKTKKKKIKRKK